MPRLLRALKNNKVVVSNSVSAFQIAQPSPLNSLCLSISHKLPERSLGGLTSRACCTQHSRCRVLLSLDDGTAIGHAQALNDRQSESGTSYDIRIDWLPRSIISSGSLDFLRQPMFVEVKGTTRAAPVMTAAQVDVARAQGAAYVLVVVKVLDDGSMSIGSVLHDPVRLWQERKLRCDWAVHYERLV
jgi:hypothetical protein